MNFTKSIAFPFFRALDQNKLIMTYFLTSGGQEMSEMMNDKIFTGKKLGFTYRQISTWDKSGLLDVERQGTDWRMFSYLDKVWLNIIRELRKYGISLKQIAKIKECLNLDNVVSTAEMPLLEYYTAIGTSRRIPICIIVFEDASSLICKYGEWLSIELGQMVPNHLIIHMGQIFAKVFNDKSLIPDVGRLSDFTDEELNILYLIREGEYEQVIINYKGKKAETLKGLKRFDVQTKISEILNDKEYQSIEVVKHAGKIRQITRWEKVKL